MMLQEIRNLNDYENTILIRCGDNDSIDQVGKAIGRCLGDDHQYYYVFIDEVTKAKGFIAL